jgi:CarboxypepD_reg-like domain/TonB-dependent Receptor Plug Domain/TonB dependent receptor
MCKRIGILMLFLLFSSTVLFAQKFTISGYVKDAESGETVIAANISIKGKNGMLSNQYGFWSVTLAKGEYQIVASHVGYKPSLLNVNLTKDTSINISLQNGTNLSEEVVVTSTKRENNIRAAQMGKITLPIDQIKGVPAFMGEVDLLKVVQLLPGVRNAGEGSSGIYVRGGGPDQNLIMLDDAVVYNTGHLFGFFSIFNADAIKNVSLIKGGMPAQYGGRLSSVLDVSMKEGNNQKFQTEGGIGLIASRFSVQGPIQKDKSSFIISARRTYIDALTKPFVKKTSQFYGSGYYFYDLNAKINYKFNDKDRVYLSGYFGRDVFDFNNGKQDFKVNIPWGNATGTLRWNHVFSRKLFANTTAVYNDYNFTFKGVQSNFEIKLASGIRDVSVKQDYDYYPASNHKLKFGWLYTYHRFTPSVVSGKQDSISFNPQNAQVKFANETAIYVQDDWDVSKKVKINIGLRYSNFAQIGAYKIYKTDALENRIDSTIYKKGQTVKSYGGLEPRLTMRYELNSTTSVKASATRNLQYIHLVSNSGTTLPTDIWVPSTYKVKPQISWLYAAGLFKNFKENMYETSVEVYYKSMANQIEYREGYTNNSLKDTEDDFIFGKGWSYGTELFINKTKGRFTGWVGYTLSWTYRKFDKLNQGIIFPAKYDRRNDMSIVAMYELNKKWKFSAAFVYGTGNATSLPERFYLVSGVITQEYSKINQYRLPSYHRIDFSATLTPKRNERRKLKTEWVFSVYNAYSRQNPYFTYFDQSGNPLDGTFQIQAKQVSIFPIIPSVTWNFKL